MINKQKTFLACTLSIAFILHIFSSSAHAQDNSIISNITEAVTNICNKPADAGKYWDVAIDGKGAANIKLLLANTGLTSNVEFSQGEWEGAKSTIENSKDYRECVKALAPIFISKFSGKANALPPKADPSRSLGGLTWKETYDGVSAELKSCKKKGSEMICHFILEALNTDTKSTIDCRRNRCPSYDQEGNTFYAEGLSVANMNQNKELQFTLIQGIPTKAKLTFNGVFATSSTIPKLTLNLNRKLYQFRNMEININ